MSAKTDHGANSHECPECGETFGSKRALGSHRWQAHSEEELPYRDAERLREMYWEKDMSVPEIADEFEVVPETIYDIMDEFGIDRDASRWGHKSRVEYATYYLDDSGYPRWQAKARIDGERVTDNFYVHRLLAIAEYGVEAVKGVDVHHRNGLRWDNRPANIELVDHAKHRRRHRLVEIERERGSVRSD